MHSLGVLLADRPQSGRRAEHAHHVIFVDHAEELRRVRSAHRLALNELVKVKIRVTIQAFPNICRLLYSVRAQTFYSVKWMQLQNIPVHIEECFLVTITVD